jgi:hypothetical protein
VIVNDMILQVCVGVIFYDETHAIIIQSNCL